MSAVVRRRERIARVRRVEHVLAAGAAAAAEAQLESLEHSAARVLDLRLSLTTGVGSMLSESLAARGELAHRLDVARFGLADAIAGARAVVATRSAERVEARIRQESADRLVSRAEDAADALAERRTSAYARSRLTRGFEGGSVSVSSIAFLSGAGAIPDGAPFAAGSADTHMAFADAMAGASKSKAIARPGRTDVQVRDTADRDTPARAKDDHDEDDPGPLKDKDRNPPTVQLQSTAGTSAPAAHEPGAKSAGKSGEAVRAASGDADRTPATRAEPDAAPAEFIDPTLAAPVLAALAEAAAAGHGKPAAAETAATPDPAPAAAPQPLPQAEAAVPLPTTAAMMAARAVVSAVAQPKEARETVAPRKARDAAAADKTASIDSLVTAGPAPAADALQADVSPALFPDATRQLADGGAGRQLDLAKQGAWLDGLSRDIAATGDASGTLRFQVAPQHLGLVQVELARGAEGAAVTLTASSESARTMLADARPQLVAEARAQGIHIADAQVDVSADSRQSGSGAQPEPHHDTRGQTGFSSQMSGGGTDNGRSQTRSQPIAVNQNGNGRADAPAGEVDTASGAGPADGMYA